MNTQSINTVVAAYTAAHPWLLVAVVWEVVWKLIALWKAAKRNHLTMFILIGVLNTLGILPIAYLLWLHFKKAKPQTPAQQ